MKRLLDCRGAFGWLAFFLAGSILTVMVSQAGAGDGIRSDAVVQVNAATDQPAPDGSQVITIKLALAKERNWHLYANPLPEKFPGVPTTVAVTAGAKPEDVKVDYPVGTLMKDAEQGDYHVYEDKVDIKVNVHRAPGETGPVELTMKFQACWSNEKNEGQCLLPATVKLTVP